MPDVHRYVRSLNVKVDDVRGIAAVFENRNQVARIGFRNEAASRAFLNENRGLRTITLDNREINVIIKDSNEEEKYVRIAGLPYELDFRIIERRLKDYGKVLSLRWEKYHVVNDEFLYPVLSSWLICRMIIEKDIPSYLTIGSYRAIVKYHGQKPTCRICDEPNHMGRDCPTLRKNKVMAPVANPLDRPTGSKEQTVTIQQERTEPEIVQISDSEIQALQAETTSIENILETESMEITIEQVIPETPIELIPQEGNESIDSTQFLLPSIVPDSRPNDEDADSVRSDLSTASTQRKKTKPNPPPTTKSRPANQNATSARQVGDKTLQSSSSPAEPPAKKKWT